MSERPKISVKPRAPARDPHRPPVRGYGAPRPPAPRRSPEPDTPPAGRHVDSPPAPASLRQGDTPHRPPRAERAERAERPPRDRAERPPRPDRPAPPPQAQRMARPERSPPPAPRPAPRPAAAAAQAPGTPHADGLRVAKLMTDRGLASRREADEWIEAGWVRVDGRLAVLGQRARTDAVIDIDPRARAEQARRVTILLHKPVGYVSGQAEDGHEPAAVLLKPENRWEGDASGINFQVNHLRHLAPAGRLDIDSTGLLVLTQDGRIAKRLIGDQTRVEKEYLVRVAYTREGRLPDEDLERLRHGLELDGVQLRPARVSWQNEDQLRFVLREGRKRQIRRMCELVGLEVLGLKRVRIGSVALGPLPAGQWRYLRDDERF
ncbi:pseudouridine synthase [Rubrivivax rivuli]|uniref:Dual-specificity RNA pseudouridine synthase RluF n=1 Tax=Rubrivivax rivuli TaxID=1862385 RepID=A0A437REF7_9BURK|nr:pseudouridine synthase [Rubrivivax rivuli]RVU45146.1 rRNA pseudouridine synthase [Rubrivivax rivuli]